MSSLQEIRDDRIKKAEKLRELGINPYPSKSFRDTSCDKIASGFVALEGKTVTIAGRLMSRREHGGIFFGDLVDETGKIQLYIKEEDLGQTDPAQEKIGFDNLNLIDTGDIIEAEGVVTKTKRGEISVSPTKLRMLTKSIRSLPEKHEGLKDVEEIYRKRYLDLMLNPDKKDYFERKTRFWQLHRDFLDKKGFKEIQIPIMELATGGADASPFVTHHNALDQDFYLRISLELNLKRLTTAGFDKVYSIGPVFRNEGIDDEHLQEYFMIEWYWAYADYNDNMELSRELFIFLAKELYGKTEFEHNGHKFDLASDWQKIDYSEIIKEKFGIDIATATEAELEKIIEKEGIKIDGPINKSRLVDNIWKLIRKDITGPAFLINEPTFMSPLAKTKPDNPALTERFHIIIAGSELANAYTELNDPIDQFKRFKDQQDARDAGDDESQMMDIDFVEMLEYGMPPVSGYGHSERIFWFLEGVSAREGTLFPQMKKKTTESQKKIYGIKDSE